MDIMIYEDQTGLMLFPTKKTEKDVQIVSFFNNNVDLYADKIGDNVTIYCHLMAFETSSRPLGYYVIYKNVYGDNVFSNFKKDMDNILNRLKIQPRIGHEDNVIFENIGNFDDGYQCVHKDTEIILKALELNKRLSYNVGNIKDITIFCRQLLKMNKRIKIAILTGKSDMGDVNILRNKMYQERLAPTDETKIILDEQKESIARKLSEDNRKIIEEKKRIDGDVGDNKIREGITSIKDGLRIKRSAGYVTSEIDTDIRKINNAITDKPLFDTSKNENTEQKQNVSSGTDMKLFAIASVTMLILGMVAGMFIYPFLPDDAQDKISNIAGKGTPIPTPMTTVIEASEKTSISTPMATDVSVPMVTVTIAPVLGNTTGNITGNATGNTTGNITGNATGNITGNATGNTTDNITNNKTGNTP